MQRIFMYQRPVIRAFYTSSLTPLANINPYKTSCFSRLLWLLRRMAVFPNIWKGSLLKLQMRKAGVSGKGKGLWWGSQSRLRWHHIRNQSPEGMPRGDSAPCWPLPVAWHHRNVPCLRVGGNMMLFLWKPVSSVLVSQTCLQLGQASRLCTSKPCSLYIYKIWGTV